jgi:5-methylcytosine-specific restriction enzyme A
MSTERIAKLLAPKGYCRGCHKLVPKGRRKWCSDACVQAALIKLDPSIARQRVWQRDRGVCAQCGFDTVRAEHVLRWLQHHALGSAFGTCRDADEAIHWLARHWGIRADQWHIGHLWEADHIVPVIEGGGACELENYRTLCVLCHRAETRALRRRLADRRNIAQRLPGVERSHP